MQLLPYCLHIFVYNCFGRMCIIACVHGNCLWENTLEATYLSNKSGEGHSVASWQKWERNITISSCVHRWLAEIWLFQTAVSYNVKYTLYQVKDLVLKRM